MGFLRRIPDCILQGIYTGYMAGSCMKYSIRYSEAYSVGYSMYSIGYLYGVYSIRYSGILYRSPLINKL